MAITAVQSPRIVRAPFRRVGLLAIVVGALLLPPLVFDLNPLRGEPLASGAEPAYPLNHSFDADVQPVGTPPANADFEAAPFPTGATPTNFDFSAAPQELDYPTNYNFESGTFAGWTTSGAVTLQSDPTQGYYARFEANAATIESDPFTISATAQKLLFDVGRTSTSGTVYIIYRVKYGQDYSSISSDLLISCGSNCPWQTLALDLSPYAGQSVKVQFVRHISSTQFGLDNIRTQVVLPGFDLVGTGTRAEDGGNAYAALNGGYLVSAPFTVDSAAQYGVVDIKGLTTLSDQYYIYVLYGPNFETQSSYVALGTIPDEWTQIRFNISAWLGQTIKLKVQRAYATIGVDNVGVQMVDIPEWDATDEARRESDGAGGTAISTDGDLTSQPFTIPSDAQQISIRHQGLTSVSKFYVQLLLGPNFDTTVNLSGGQVSSTLGEWSTAKYAVQQYAGETVKLRISQYWGRPMFDDLGFMEITTPGWENLTNVAIDVGEDENGTFVSSPGPSSAWLRSSDIDLGVIDNPYRVDLKYYSFTYDALPGKSGVTRVNWVGESGATSYVLTDAAVSGTGLRTKYFYVADSMEQRGHFEIQVSAVKVYGIAENIARQQLQEPFSQKVGSGIDTSTGGFGYVDKDLQLSGTMPLNFTRFYTAQSDRRGTLGYRWSHSYDTRLEFGAQADVGVIFGSGGEEFFDGDPFGINPFVPVDPRVHDELVKNPDGTYTFTTTNNLKYQFTSSGQLTSIDDLNGNSTVLAYNASGLVETVTDPDGRALTFTYNASNQLTGLSAPAGASLSYSYDASGDLVSVTDPEAGVRAYTYDKHRLTQAKDQNDKVVFTNVFDAFHRVTAQTDALNNTLSISYDDPAKGVTKVTDPLSNVARYYFDVAHRTTDKVDPLGHVESYVYDSSGNLQKVIDPVNNQWQFAYDASGSVTSLNDPLGNPMVVSYNALHLPTTVTDARGYTTTMTYDAQGNMLTKTDPLGKTTSYSYDSAGRMLTMTDPLGNIETYTYDTAGNLASKTNAVGKTWTYTYDLSGRRTSETDPLGIQRSWAYDLAGRMIVERDGLSQEKNWIYDPAGHLVSEEDQTGAQTIWTYDDRGLVIARTDPAGNVTSYAYNADQMLTAETDPLGRATSYAYTSDRRVASVTDPDGGVTTYAYTAAGYLASQSDPLNRTTSYTHDNSGRVLTLTLPTGGLYAYQYDPNGNLVAQTNPLNHFVTYTYDANNRRIRITDPFLNQTNYTYDAAGRLIEVKDALNQITAYAYDDAGQLASVTDPLNAVWSFTYDDAGRRSTSTDPLSRTTSYAYDLAGRLSAISNAAGKTTGYGYDAAGRRISVTDPMGGVTASTYDPRGLLLSVTNPLQQTTSYTYDNAGQRMSMTDPRGYTTTYGYDDAGRQTTMTDAQGGVVTFAYDLAGQQTALTNPRGKTTTFTYDAAGNMLTETDPLNHTKSWTYDLAGQMTSYTDGRGIAQVYAYDAAGRQTGIIHPGGSVVYGYDALGRQTSVLDATGTTTRNYDAASMVTSVTSPQGTVEYTYNLAGQRASMTLPGGRTVTYGYDNGGRLASLTDWLANVTSFNYDDNGRRTGIVHPNGVTSTYVYDSANRVTAINHSGPTSTLLAFAYTYDENGNRTSVVKDGGNPESYTLDSLNRLTGVTYADGTAQSYTYDANGNRLTKTENGTTTTYTYDDGDQLTSDGTATYTYDANGNLISRGTDTFTWDYASRMTGASVGGVSATYSYDGEDVRVGKSVSGTPVTYLWDRESGLPLLVDDGANAYLQSGGVLGEIAGASREDLLGDALGAVRGVSDGTGTLAGATDYDVFGSSRATNGATSGFGFTGEQPDAETGFVYLRARYLDAASGRFTSADDVVPNAPGSQGFNPYAYVANNPTTWIDPSGHTVAPPAVGSYLWVWQSLLLNFLVDACARYTPCAVLLGQAVGEAAQRKLTTAVLIGAAAILVCALSPQCMQFAMHASKTVASNGSRVISRVRQEFDRCSLYNLSVIPPVLTPERIKKIQRDHGHNSTVGSSKFYAAFDSAIGLESLLAVGHSLGRWIWDGGACVLDASFAPLVVGTAQPLDTPTSCVRLVAGPMTAWSAGRVLTMYPTVC